jgi:hypothetical protein
MAIILKTNKVNLFVSDVLFVFWYHSPNILDTLHICNISWLRVKLVKKFPVFYETPKFLYHTHKCPPTVPILSQLHPVPTTPPTSRRSVLILSSHLRLVSPMASFPEVSLCTRLSSNITCHMLCPSHSRLNTESNKL